MKSIVLCAAYLSTAERGFDIYTIDKDFNVETVTTNGFGDPYNHGCRVFATTDDDLIVGTANPFYGTQIWTLDENMTEDIYDINGDGKDDVNDITFMQRIIAGSEEKGEDFDEIADINKDGRVDANDITAYQLFISNK